MLGFGGYRRVASEDHGGTGSSRSRALLQYETQALDDRISEPYGVRTEGRISLTACHSNRVQAPPPPHGTSNRSHRSSNEVSGIKTQIVKIRKQRLARKIRPTSPEIRKNARQRLRIVLLTRGNVAQIFGSRTCPTETGLAGWGARTRTWEWRNQNPLPYHLATPHQAARLPPRRADHSGGARTDQRP